MYKVLHIAIPEAYTCSANEVIICGYINHAGLQPKYILLGSIRHCGHKAN